MVESQQVPYIRFAEAFLFVLRSFGAVFWKSLVLFRLRRNSLEGFWAPPKSARTLPLTREGTSSLSKPFLGAPWCVGRALFSRRLKNCMQGFWAPPRPTRALPLTREGTSSLSKPVLGAPWGVRRALFSLRLKNCMRGFWALPRPTRALPLTREGTSSLSKPVLGAPWLCYEKSTALFRRAFFITYSSYTARLPPI